MSTRRRHKRPVALSEGRVEHAGRQQGRDEALSAARFGGHAYLASSPALLRQMDEANRARSVRWLQRTYGNTYVQRVLNAAGSARAGSRDFHAASMPGAVLGLAPAAREDAAQDSAAHSADTPGSFQSVTEVVRYPFTAELRRGPARQAGEQAPAAAARSDAPPGAEEKGEQFAGLFQQLGESASPPGLDLSEGESDAVEVPDIEFPELAGAGKSDAIKGSFTYSGSISRGGAAPSGFGTTRSFNSKLSGITITPSGGTFGVKATYEHPITYQVRSGTGPDSQKDIASDADGDITKDNYTTVVSDLTPDMSDLNGRPPRSKFWAEDLTLRHELVHANDDKSNGPGAMATVTTWLNGQTAANEAEVNAKLARLPGRFASALLAALPSEEGEERAYGDGAPHYKARAESIKKKGDKGEYE